MLAGVSGFVVQSERRIGLSPRFSTGCLGNSAPPFSSPTGKSKIPWNIKGPIFSVILTFCLFVAKGSFDLRDPVPLIEPFSESNFLNYFKHAELSCSRSNPAEHTNRQGSLFP